MPSLEIAREGSVPPVLFGICTAAWNPGAAGLAISPDACRPTSEKTERARRGRRRFSIGGPPTCRATALAVARFATVQTVDARSRGPANRAACGSASDLGANELVAIRDGYRLRSVVAA